MLLPLLLLDGQYRLTVAKACLAVMATAIPASGLSLLPEEDPMLFLWSLDFPQGLVPVTALGLGDFGAIVINVANINGAGPIFGRFTEFDIHFVPVPELQLFHITVKVLNFHCPVVVVHCNDAEALPLVTMVVPVVYDWIDILWHTAPPEMLKARVTCSSMVHKPKIRIAMSAYFNRFMTENYYVDYNQ
jgi:hypothetical protein